MLRSHGISFSEIWLLWIRKLHAFDIANVGRYRNIEDTQVQAKLAVHSSRKKITQKSPALQAKPFTVHRNK